MNTTISRGLESACWPSLRCLCFWADVLSSRLGYAVLAGFFAALTAIPCYASEPSSAAFGYRGVLNEFGRPVTGTFDLRFELHGAATGIEHLIRRTTNVAVFVDQGQLMTYIDFGPGAFDDQAVWLDIGVRARGEGAFTSLTPRHPLDPIPRALHAASADNAEFSKAAGQAASVHPAFWGDGGNVRRVIDAFNAQAAGKRWSWSLMPLIAGEHASFDTSTSGPAGLVTLRITNVLSGLTNSGTIWVDAGAGDDITAMVGRADRAFRTLPAALSHMTNACTLRIRPGTYTVSPGQQRDKPPYNAALVIEDRKDIALIGDGPGVVIQASGEGNVILLRNTTNVLVQNLTIRGVVNDGRSEDNRYYALLLCDGQNRQLRVLQCRFLDSGDQAIAHLYGPRTTYDWDISHNYFENIGTTNCTALGSDGAAVAIGGSDGIAIGNRMHNILRGFEIEGQASGDAKQRILLHGNTITGIWDGVDDGGYGIVVIANPMGGSRNIAEISIEGNVIDAAPATTSWRTGGVVASGGDYFAVRNNTIRRCGSGISLFSSLLPMTKGIVSGNLVIASVFRGIHIANYGSNKLEGFLISGNVVVDGLGNGLELQGSFHSAVGNHIMANRGIGVRVSSSTYLDTTHLFLANNFCVRNSNAGIVIEKDPRNTVLSNNMLIENGIVAFGFVTNLIDRSNSTLSMPADLSRHW